MGDSQHMASPTGIEYRWAGTKRQANAAQENADFS